MNLPNKLTVARIIATPIFMFTMIYDFTGHYFLALLIFIAASLTDMLDGKIARSRNLITDFGKFLDPLADKMLTTAAFIGFLKNGVGDGIAWIVFIVLFREFMITSLRLVSVQSGKVIAANMWGKAKTVSQMIAIIITMSLQCIMSVVTMSQTATAVIGAVITALLWISAVLTVISGVIYMLDNRDAVDPSK